jgi:hypothetical protein
VHNTLEVLVEADLIAVVMIHRHSPWKTAEELKAIVVATPTASKPQLERRRQ